MSTKPTIIAVDFDGTLCEHRFPEIGREVPQAFRYLREFSEQGARLILHTMRSDRPASLSADPGPEGVPAGRLFLTEAVDWCAERGIFFWSVNSNPEQHTWTSSPKPYAHLYIDDAAFGCPLIYPPGGHAVRPYVDWSVVGPIVLDRLK